jgi:hypothetical protein
VWRLHVPDVTLRSGSGGLTIQAVQQAGSDQVDVEAGRFLRAPGRVVGRDAIRIRLAARAGER